VQAQDFAYRHGLAASAARTFDGTGTVPKAAFGRSLAELAQLAASDEAFVDFSRAKWASAQGGASVKAL
jgi:hypothetical protein